MDTLVVEWDQQRFDGFWDDFSRRDVDGQRDAVRELYRQVELLVTHVLAELQSDKPAERFVALMLVRRTDLAAKCLEQVIQLSDDPEPVIRASVMTILATVPCEQSKQRLLAALDDADPRVQSNAIEALEMVDPDNIHQIAEPKTQSPHHRVRATAIRAVLKYHGTAALTELSAMLDHHDPAFRLSALWAVRQTLPQLLIEKVSRLAGTDPDAKTQHTAAEIINGIIEWGAAPSPTLEEALA
ncbi:MAG: hypothetical protein GXY33_18335 [Phycisphaerae bacterium]|nr:hypothetical protein [Phycisphaerae bacterium]